jgi:acetyl-CoA carboxylase carboxyl transferase subunit alpha
MGITAERLAELRLVDEVLAEPLGGAHRDPEAMALTVKDGLLRHLNQLSRLPTEKLLAERTERLAAFGVFTEQKA